MPRFPHIRQPDAIVGRKAAGGKRKKVEKRGKFLQIQKI